MSKTLVTIILSVILFVIFGNAFSASYTSRKMENLAYVLALGIDVGEEAKLKVSAQFTKSAAFSAATGSTAEDIDNIILVSGEADSIFSAINLLNSYIGKEINLSHCSLIIFSEEFAKNGISTEIYSLMNNEEIRPSANLIISTCSAYDYLNHSNPNLEKLTTQYYETFAITDRFTGYFSNITIGNFFNTLTADYCDSTAILGGLNATARKEAEKKAKEESSGSSSGGGSSSSSGSSGGGSSSGSESSAQTTNNPDTNEISVTPDIETNPENITAGTSTIVGDRGTENFGIAVFKDDKLCGQLTAVESICHLLINNKIDSCIVSIDNPLVKNQDTDDVEKMELQLFPAKNTKINVDIKNHTLAISIDLSLDADIMTLSRDINYETNEALTRVSDSLKDYLEKQFKGYLDKVSKEYSTDIDQFSTKAPAHFATIDEFKKFNWNEKYKDAKFNINIDINVISSLLLTKT